MSADIYNIYSTKYSNSWALIIGIDKYKNASPLNYACSDAKAIADLLHQKFDFPKKNITLLLDNKASKRSLEKAFLRFSNDDILSDDRILFFFAGHGHTYTGRRGEIGYLIPFDGNTNDLSTLIRWDKIVKDSEIFKAKHILFIIDSCYGGVVATRSGVVRYLKSMLQRLAIQVLTAGKADEQVADAGGPLPKHSMFTGHLIKALQGEAASEDGIITANNVMAYVYEKVSKDNNSKQTPQYGHLEGDGDFIFAAPSLESINKKVEIDEDILIETPVSPAISIGSLNEPDIIGKTKDFLSDARSRIKLDDLVTGEIRRVESLLNETFFPVNIGVTSEEFATRLKKYEFIIHDLQGVTINLAYWGKDYNSGTLKKIISRISEPEGPKDGKVIWLRLKYYPSILLMYSSGISAIHAGKYDILASLFNMEIEAEESFEGKEEFILKMGQVIVDLERTNAFKILPEHKRYYVPRSEYIFKVLQPTLEDLLFLGRKFEFLFDRFEALLALVHADLYDKRVGHIWGPIGRFGWKYNRSYGKNILLEIKKEAEAQLEHWAPLKAGLFEGRYERFKKVYDGYEERISGLNWF